MKPMLQKDLELKGMLWIDQIQDGFEKYPFFVIKGDYLKLRAFLRECKKLNGDEGYFDFYYGELSEEEQKGFQAGLSLEEKEILETFSFESGEVFYPLEEKVLNFASDITARGWLFSSFYFLKYPCVVWGNYNMDCPIFCKDEETLKKYEKIAKDINL